MLAAVAPQDQDPTGRVAAMELARQWAALPEPAMHGAAICNYLAQVGDARGVWTLEWIIRGARQGHRACLTVYGGLVDPDPLLASLGKPRLLALYAEAERSAPGVALQWLYTCVTPAAEPDEGSQDLVHRELRALTLGDRRALARRSRGDALKRLLCDPDPGVIGNVLNNAQTTEASVLAICSRRPTVAAPLGCVLRHPRWNTRYRVKVALVRNPYLPARLGINLLVYMNTPDLTAIGRDETLAEELRLAAQRLLHIGGDRDALGG